MSNRSTERETVFSGPLREEQVTPGLPYYRYETQNGLLYSGYFTSVPQGGEQEKYVTVQEGRLKGLQPVVVWRNVYSLSEMGVASSNWVRNDQSLIFSPVYPNQMNAFLDWLERRASSGDMHAIMWDVIIRPLWELEEEADAAIQKQQASVKNNPWSNIHEDLEL